LFPPASQSYRLHKFKLYHYPLVTGAAVIALPAPDPIHGAIENHRAAFANLDAVHAHLVATDGPDEPLYAALAAWMVTVKTLIATVPTTCAGLRALTLYMSKPRNEHIGRAVKWVDTHPCGAVTCSMSEAGGPWLLAKHAERLAGV
jgi:hypothetical protein